ncbi:monovalent cation/H+ antiporter complex subunit F [Methylobacterium sp. NEAU 140]|uniref:monovalent cation/H+ antiporter complex subunit F n=1 Tax=Methylobacterium sp. NEAU 140 TaxID=3064945 RepID=UPI002736B05A|nr:monovalent cation/H+ antiporter complex subunit F [Methylobacterium sp. NEAU 140]MDP4024184.1 monovalent cation/H+ antiporter complex subunit F [Methylobacterium sp. NEAU 140]
MSVWTAAMLALLPPLALATALAWRGRPGQRFAAFQVATTVTVAILTLFTFASDQASLIDLALTLVLLNLPGTLLLAVFLERWI